VFFVRHIPASNIENPAAIKKTSIPENKRRKVLNI